MTTDERIAAMLPLSPRDYLILFALVDGDRHGYGLVKDVERLSEGAVRIDPANLYRSLRRMVKTGLVVESERRLAAMGDEHRGGYWLILRGQETSKTSGSGPHTSGRLRASGSCVVVTAWALS